jgi:hypothetical protein
MPDRDRSVSVARTEGALTADALSAWLVGREAYRHTRFIAVRGDDGVALVEVERADAEPLFSVITSIRLLAGPDTCAWIEVSDIDTSVPSQVALAARTHAPEAAVVVVSGRYGHVGFIADAQPNELRVIDVVPPFPPKLVDQVRRLLDTAEELPPIVLREELIDLRELALEVPSDTYLLPCRAGGTAIDGHDIVFLDERPPHDDWVLVGCARSRELHRWFYEEQTVNIDSCPRERSAPDIPTLTKCCLLDQGIEQHGATVTVPWGASLAEVREALELLVQGKGSRWAPG